MYISYMLMGSTVILDLEQQVAKDTLAHHFKVYLHKLFTIS